MKRHFGRMLHWSLASYRGDLEFERRLKVAGVGPKTLWEMLVDNPKIRNMPSYQVLEELFLDNTRQLRPQLRVSSTQVSSFLDKGDLSGAIKSVSDYSETVGFFECIYNYLTKDTMIGFKKELPALLIMIRMCQFIWINPHCRLAQIRSFLLSLGYQVNDLKISFYLYVLLRNELILWQGEEGFRSIDDAIFHVGLRGSVLIRKMQYCISYFSEGLSISELPVDGLAGEFIARDFSSNPQWILNCVVNAIIGFNIVMEIEELEARMAEKAKINFTTYKIVDTMRKNLSSEGQKIISGSFGPRRAELFTRISEIKRRHPSLEFFVEQ